MIGIINKSSDNNLNTQISDILLYFSNEIENNELKMSKSDILQIHAYFDEDSYENLTRYQKERMFENNDIDVDIIISNTFSNDPIYLSDYYSQKETLIVVTSEDSYLPPIKLLDEEIENYSCMLIIVKLLNNTIRIITRWDKNNLFWKLDFKEENSTKNSIFLYQDT